MSTKVRCIEAKTPERAVCELNSSKRAARPLQMNARRHADGCAGSPELEVHCGCRVPPSNLPGGAEVACTIHPKPFGLRVAPGLTPELWYEFRTQDTSSPWQKSRDDGRGLLG